MAEISIVQAHQLTLSKAREAAQKVADQMAREYDLACAWEGDVLRFERTWVEGALSLETAHAHMSIKLGSLMSMFAPAIESKVAEKMKKVFDAKS